MMIQNVLATAGLIATPLAPAVVWGARVYESVLPHAGKHAAIASAVSAGFGLECVGMIAGHAFIKLHTQGDSKKWGALAILLSYAGIGIWELGVGDALGKLFIVGFLLYIVNALKTSADDGDKASAMTLAAQSADAKAERNRAHQLALIEAENRKMIAIERARINAQAKAQVGESFAQLSPTAQEPAQAVIRPSRSWHDLTQEEREGVSAMSSKAIAEQYAVSLRTAQNWRSWANGSASKTTISAD